ncbi:hypothetical protein Rhal01_00909 [Rubritalea halochordaticola]|uniref:Uncharacterized protein n=1 Tax=Rubritalea halochordaticola TaxID=714537 RepID=A0ABP9UWG0_9BACT
MKSLTTVLILVAGTAVCWVWWNAEKEFSKVAEASVEPTKTQEKYMPQRRVAVAPASVKVERSSESVSVELEKLKLEWGRLHESAASNEERRALADRSIRELLCSPELFELSSYLKLNAISTGGYDLTSTMRVFEYPLLGEKLKQSIIEFLSVHGESLGNRSLYFNHWIKEAAEGLSDQEFAEIMEKLNQHPSTRAKFQFYRIGESLDEDLAKGLAEILPLFLDFTCGASESSMVLEKVDSSDITPEIMEMVAEQRLRMKELNSIVSVDMLEQALLRKLTPEDRAPVEEFIKTNYRLYTPEQLFSNLGVDDQFARSLPAGEQRDHLLERYIGSYLIQGKQAEATELLPLIKDSDLKTQLMINVELPRPRDGG